MLVISSLGSVAYTGMYAFGNRLGIGQDRRNLFARSAILFVGWALVCCGHYATPIARPWTGDVHPGLCGPTA
jgi:hypothetical protein